MENLCRQVYSALCDKEAKAVYQSARDLFTDGVVGGFVFYSGISSAQFAQRVLRISASTPIVSSVVGCSAVIGSSILAIATAPLPRRAMQSSKPIQMPSLEPIQLVSYGLCGVTLFRILRGRFFTLAPSDYRNLGAFNRQQASLPATTEYADTSKRAVINTFGRLFGCHTCGVKKSVQFHADHMPPVNFVKKANARLLRRLLGLRMLQRYYPQCSVCSNQQGMLVQKNAKKLKTHFTSLRTYHFTGFWLTILCCGGLFQAPNEKQEALVVRALTNKAVGAFQGPALAVLGEQEEFLRFRRDISEDADEIRRLTHAIKEIERKKAKVKRIAKTRV